MDKRMLEHIDSEIGRLRKEAEDLNDKLAKLYQERALLTCPYHLGQVLELPEMRPQSFIGYDKPKAGERVRVTHILPMQSGQSGWRIRGELVDRRTVRGQLPWCFWSHKSLPVKDS